MLVNACATPIRRRRCGVRVARIARQHPEVTHSSEHPAELYQRRIGLTWLLKRAFHQGHGMIDATVREHGVTAAQLGVLMRLAAEPGMSGAELARWLYVTPQAVQLTLAALEKRGLVERTPDPNHGRIVRAALTPEGQNLADMCFSDAVAAEERFAAVLDEKERETLMELLARLVAQPSVDGIENGDHPEDVNL